MDDFVGAGGVTLERDEVGKEKFAPFPPVVPVGESLTVPLRRECTRTV